MGGLHCGCLELRLSVSICYCWKRGLISGVGSEAFGTECTRELIIIDRQALRGTCMLWMERNSKGNCEEYWDGNCKDGGGNGDERTRKSVRKNQGYDCQCYIH